MTQQSNNGGAAFPQSIHPDGPFGGMTLHDYVAAHCLAGWLASFGPTDAVKPKNCVNLAFDMADEFMKERAARAQDASHDAD